MTQEIQVVMVLSNPNRSVGGTEKQALSRANELVLKGVGISFLSQAISFELIENPTVRRK